MAFGAIKTRVGALTDGCRCAADRSRYDREPRRLALDCSGYRLDRHRCAPRWTWV